MDYFDLLSNNEKSKDSTRFSKLDLHDVSFSMTRHKYRGFVNCIACDGDQSFVMFTNSDDVVASHYLFSGPASFESGSLKLWSFLSKRSTWIYDVGAFTGVFALTAAANNPNCFVMAFEPSFVTYSRLLVNISANEFDARIAPVRFGIADREGHLELRHPAGVYALGSGESFSDRQIENPWFTESVPVVSLDYLLSNQGSMKKQLIIAQDFLGADLLKIDVEGFEDNVIRGMQKTISDFKPIAIVEILDEYRVGEIREIFGDDYAVFIIDEATGKLKNSGGDANKLFIQKDKLHILSDYAPGFL
ncbi:FkbM family methyltransferase [Erythrobacter sp. T5W1-R]|uniref:FkbM family methyltransferase n=1 Tax=Erythrobacter sp. T5W1-R TaxID=3101752 RepID=UPI002AFE0A0F|nr:FkbM family methyltransferase [Erythrobacter sp. T5W1-R]MEA1619903.1 FkbM family methyltransferase [Erythrobacter sp. T5W1-R]